MIANDIFSDEEAIEADLALQECLLWSRAELFDRLTAASSSQVQVTAETLRLDAMSPFVEFFYLIRARRIETTDQITRLAEIHNEHIDLLCRDASKMKQLGLRKDRLLDAIFTSDTLPRLTETWKLHPGRIDQSNCSLSCDGDVNRDLPQTRSCLRGCRLPFQIKITLWSSAGPVDGDHGTNFRWGPP